MVDGKTFVKRGSGAVALHDGAPVGPSRLGHERVMASFAAGLRTADGRRISPAVQPDPLDTEIAFEFVDGVLLAELLDMQAPDVAEHAVRRLAEATALLHCAPSDGTLPSAPQITATPFDLAPADLAGLSAAAVRAHRDAGGAPTRTLWSRLVGTTQQLPITETVIHNDLRAVNVLVTDDGELRLVDWEFAGRGAPARDVGSVLADLVRHALATAWRARRSATPPGDAHLARLFLSDYALLGPTLDPLRVEAELAVALFGGAVARCQSQQRYHPVDRAAMGVVRHIAAAPGLLWRSLEAACAV